MTTKNAGLTLAEGNKKEHHHVEMTPSKASNLNLGLSTFVILDPIVMLMMPDRLRLGAWGGSNIVPPHTPIIH